jgi:hypothetical protein
LQLKHCSRSSLLSSTTGFGNLNLKGGAVETVLADFLLAALVLPFFLVASASLLLPLSAVPLDLDFRAITAGQLQ